MTTATIGERYQVVIPRKERERIGLKPHMKVQVEVENDAVIVRPVSVKRLRGLGRDLPAEKNATDYIQRLRNEWKERG